MAESRGSMSVAQSSSRSSKAWQAGRGGSADGSFPREEIKRGTKAEAAVTYYQAAAEGARSSDGEGAQEEQAGRNEHPRKHLLHGIVCHFLAWKELPEYRSEYPSCAFYPIADN